MKVKVFLVLVLKLVVFELVFSRGMISSIVVVPRR
jgi:hypothetical protein